MGNLPAFVVASCCLLCHVVYSQDQPAPFDKVDKVITLPSRYIDKVQEKFCRLNRQITHQSEKYLDRLANQENKLFRKLSKVDSATAAQLQRGQSTYTQLRNKIKSKADLKNFELSGGYLPFVDSIDHAGRLLKTWETINDNDAEKALVESNEYNELGQLLKKGLGKVKNEDGSYSTDSIEVLNYTYNIRGWLRSINKDFASDNSVYAPDNHWFGIDLYYDWGFDSSQFNGNITGIKWNSKSIGYKLASGFSYDKASRFMNQDVSMYRYDLGHYAYDVMFAYAVQMGDGYTASSAYDENGNIKKMKQWGWYGINAVIIDDLAYNYYDSSNKLLNVIDANNYPATYLGDFRTSTLHPQYGNKTNTTVDYTYDKNGNLTKDLNKDIGTSATSGIQYSHLNLPYKVTVYGSSGIKGTITYIYDAAGNKLEKRVLQTGNNEIRTTYLDQFVYQNDSLQFFGDPEGRTRYTKKYFANGDSTYQFIHDYFVKDHLGNVRMVLTEQKDTAKYFATMEAAYRQKEQQLFYNISNTSYPVSSVPGSYPTDNTTSPNDSLSRLNGSGPRIGPAIVLKVMAGDKIDLATKAFYQSQGAIGSPSYSLPDILAPLANGIISISGTAKGTFSELTDVPSPLYQSVRTFVLTRDNFSYIDTSSPKAYLNWIFFNDRLEGLGGGMLQVGPANTLTTLSNTITAANNGYVYIYLSNETQNWDVFFDNFSVAHRSGPLLEESHYYPFGLTMYGLSSKAFKPNYYENKKKFVGRDFEDDLGWDMYQFRFRVHDPQLGRFTQIDPLADRFPYNSTYAYAENRVGNGIDLEGLEWWASPIIFGNNTTFLRSPVLENAVESTVEGGAKISDVSENLSEGAAKPKFSPEQLQRFKEGKQVEAEQLAKNGLEKNNKPVESIDPKTGKTGETVPDAFKNDGQSTVEVKNVKSQGLTKQLRLQQKYSNDNGFDPELIINKGAQISKPLQNSTFKIRYYNSVPPAPKDAIIQGLPKLKPVPKKPYSKPCTCGTPCCI